MDGTSSLQTLAEVSVALAGFASLLVVLRRGQAPPPPGGEGADLFVVVGGGLLVLLFSLLPLPLGHLLPSASSVWVFSSALFSGCLLFGYLAILRRRSQLLRAGIRPSFPRVSQVVVQAPLVVIVLLVLNVVGVLVPQGPGVYILSLIFVLVLSAVPLLFAVIDLAAESSE